MGEPRFPPHPSPLIDAGAQSYDVLRSSDAPTPVEVQQLVGDGVSTAPYSYSRGWTFGGELSGNGCFSGDRWPSSKTAALPGVLPELEADPLPQNSTESSPRKAYRRPEEQVCSGDAKRQRKDEGDVYEIYERNVKDKMKTVDNQTCEAAAGPNCVLDDNSTRQVVEQLDVPVQISTEGPCCSPNNPVSKLSFSSSEDEETSFDVKEAKHKKRKKSSCKKLMYFFQELVKQMMMKQESLQKQLLDKLEKRENERIAREEAWRQQKMEAMRRNYELWAQERSRAASRDFSLISLLEKFLQQQNDLSKCTGVSQMEQDLRGTNDGNNNAFDSKEHHALPENRSHCEPHTAGQQIHLANSSRVEECVNNEDIRDNNECDTICEYKPSSMVQAHMWPQPAEEQLYLPKSNGSEEKILLGFHKKRWPSSEVQALIKLRIAFEHKFQTKTSRDQLWQEISRDLSSMGYNHSGKKCKEKWVNINKYFKKAKICGKLQSKDSSMCSYFRELDIFYEHGYQNSD
ncbi:hypothetical protein H6P81_008524 [Aristolochia fimbriata]|uniref:Myb-like domain-containing protein n=1 Tax=Aristolochia fimbriata TaxID=158543 RepID=A0AAV7EII7_ARIFI|nr:hypothetical protein H6P81_008524 [Aristolochia fimbriata]